jgi:hypothetical protein
MCGGSAHADACNRNNRPGRAAQVGNHGFLSRHERLLIDTERQQINALHCSGEFNDEARRRLERELDLREAHLAHGRDEE